MTIDEELDQQEADAAELQKLFNELNNEIAGLEKLEQEADAFLETLRNGT